MNEKIKESRAQENMHSCALQSGRLEKGGGGGGGGVGGQASSLGSLGQGVTLGSHVWAYVCLEGASGKKGGGERDGSYV